MVRPLSEAEQQAMMAQFVAQNRPAAAPAPVQVAVLAGAEGAPRLAGFDDGDPATWGNPGRNDDCPCGSGNKFKHCHGKLA